MDFTLPSPASPAEQARTLIAKKEAIELEISTHSSVLKANDVAMNGPLVDHEGFPRSDIDVWAVRMARVRILELKNDLDRMMREIAVKLQEVYNPNASASLPKVDDKGKEPIHADSKPFAKVGAVAPGSPAADAGLRREDFLVKFGQLNHQSFTLPSLTPLSDLVTAHENHPLSIEVLRGHEIVHLQMIPRKGWGGHGLLGCHVVPYTAPDP